MSSIKAHYVAQITIDYDVELKQGMLPKEKIKENIKNETTNFIEGALLEMFRNCEKLEVTEIQNDVIEVEK